VFLQYGFLFFLGLQKQPRAGDVLVPCPQKEKSWVLAIFIKLLFKPSGIRDNDVSLQWRQQQLLGNLSPHPAAPGRAEAPKGLGRGGDKGGERLWGRPASLMKM